MCRRCVIVKGFLFCDLLFCGAAFSTAVSEVEARYDVARVSAIVTSQMRHLPACHGICGRPVFSHRIAVVHGLLLNGGDDPSACQSPPYKLVDLLVARHVPLFALARQAVFACGVD